ncbi:MAG: hypothetical protein U0S36_12485 [Candidatus Nanopelagicales bacterium]
MSASGPRTAQVLESIQIRGGTAVWVLSAHVYALLVPLAFAVAVMLNQAYLEATTWSPQLFFIAACLLSAGGAFEAAQNTMDSWYLTADSPSANGVGLLDLMFYLLVTAGQGVSAIAIAGDRWWVWAVAVGAVVALPPVYLLGGPYFAPMSVSSLLAIGLAFEAFGDPAVFLQLLAVAATMLFFGALIRTGAQVMHGFTTVAASSGSWFLVWAIVAGARGETTSWTTVVVITAVSVAVGAAVRPWLFRLPPTPRAVTLAA